MKRQDAFRNFVICTCRQILFGWWNKG